MPQSSTIIDCTKRCKKLDQECRDSGKHSETCDRQRIRCEEVCAYM